MHKPVIQDISLTHRCPAPARVMRAVSKALFCIALTLPLSLPPVVYAQEVGRNFELAAGKLDTVLNRFADQTGVVIYFDASLAQGKNTPGLQGKFSVSEGLMRLLAGSGLKAIQEPDGSYKIISADAAVLDTLRVHDTPLGSTTEGTGSYTTGDSNTTTGLSLSPRETPQSITVMTHDRMQDQGLDDISQVMERIVGIENDSASALGTDGVSYFARGFEVENYQVDGISRPAGVYGFAEETADMIVYDRVEILRGASGLTTGMGVPSATVNLVRKRPAIYPGASVTAKTGSWGLYRLEADASDDLNESGSIRGRLTGAYQENDSFIDREHAERQAIFGVVEMDISDATLLAVSLEYQNFENASASRGGVPLFYTDGSETSFDRSTNTSADWSNFIRESLNFNAALEHQINDGWRVKLDVEHKDGSYDETLGYLFATSLDATTGAGGTIFSARWAEDLQLDTINANIEGAFDWLGNTHDLAFTLNHSVYKHEGSDYPGWWFGGDYSLAASDAFSFYATGNTPMPDLSAMDTSYGGEIEQTSLSGVVRLKPTDTLAMIVGSRVSNWKETDWTRSATGITTTTPGAEENGVLTPYAGVVLDFTDNLSVYASYTRIDEPQTRQDVSGNTLDPLEGISTELGIKGAYLNGRLTVSAAVFQMEQDNFAVAEGAGIFTPDGAVAYRAESGAESEGVELEVGGELLPGWQVSAGVAHAEVNDNEGNPLITTIPENTVKLFTSYQLRGNMNGLLVGGGLRWQDETSVEDLNPVTGKDYVQDSFMVMDLMARYVFPESISVTMNLNNVFDETYYSGLGRVSRYGVPRNASLSLRYDF